ncbi:MAG: hypothetical protein J7578_18010 [Chitinophagaceae bacterium]|nr:hypothetical protein [Chitinophagaceae bacterium]
MDIIKISDLIGQQIEEIRFLYTPETHEKYSIQSCYTFIKLSNKRIVKIPLFYSDDFIIMSPENISYFQNSFENGSKITHNAAKLIFGETIVDILFNYRGNEWDDFPPFIKLTNGYYLSEVQYAPNGIPVGPILFDEEKFQKEKQRRAGIGIDIWSYSFNKDKLQ